MKVKDPAIFTSHFNNGEEEFHLHDGDFCGPRNSTYRVCHPEQVPDKKNDPLFLKFRFPAPPKTGNENIFGQVSDVSFLRCAL